MRTTPKKAMRMLAGTLLLGGGLGTATAAVTNVAYWRGGENDVPAPSGTFGSANTTAVDGMGNGHNLAKVNNSLDNGPYYAYPSDYPGVGLPAGSSVDYAFNVAGNNAFTSSTPVSIGTTNWGVQLYVRPNSANSGQAYIQNGQGAPGSGFALFQLDAALLGQGTGVQYYAEVGGVVDMPSGILVSTGTDAVWHNLALVSDNNDISFYVDGVLKASATGVTITPIGFVGLGQNSAGSGFFSGGLDEVRVFTFAPGAFKVSDLSNYVGVIPEPASLALLGLAMLGLWRRRR